MTVLQITGIIVAVYLFVGILSFFWIKRDADFRTGPWVPIAILAIFTWPVMNLAWMLIRGDEHLTSIAAKQSHRDYQIYMRTKKDKDLFAYLPEAAPTNTKDNESSAPGNEVQTNEATKDASFQDHNIETLISSGNWDEAMAAAKQMRKVAIQLQEENRIHRYDEYIRRIEDGKRMELD